MSDRLKAPKLRGPLLAGVAVAVATCASLLLWMPLVVPPPPTPPAPEVEPEYEPSFADLMPESARAVTLEVAGGEWVRSQTKVDVIYARDVVKTGDREATTLLRDVIALPSKGGGSSLGWVTLLLGREEAERLALASMTGRISLVLRPDEASDDEAERMPRTLADVSNGTLRAVAKKRRAISRIASTGVSSVSEGMRGAPVRTGLVLLEENDRVDVMAVLPDGHNGLPMARTIFLNVAVAGVLSLPSPHEVSALLELLPEDAELLALAKSGSVHLALRNRRERPDDGSRRLTRKTDMYDLVDGERLYRLNRRRVRQWVEVDTVCGVRRRVSPVSPARLKSVRLPPGPRGGFIDTSEAPRSSLANYVDTGSFSLLQRVSEEGKLPAPEDVRGDELLNFMRWSYPAPPDAAVALNVDGAPSPFQKDRTLLRVAMRGRDHPVHERKPAHLVVLIDTSGAGYSTDHRPLAQASLRLLVDALQPQDTVAILGFRGSREIILPPTSALERDKIRDAIFGLTEYRRRVASEGLRTAYDMARKAAHAGQTSRIVLLSDGVLGTLLSPPERGAISGGVVAGVKLTTIAFGRDMPDATYELEQLANRGNGSYHYVDSLFEARRLFVEQLGGTLEVIAKDVKIQVDFNPATVKRYRLVGYENRDVADEDFRDDTVDGGEIGSGHRVTALYELELVPGAKAQSLATVHVRWKEPDGVKASELTHEVKRSQLAASFGGASRDLQFAAGVMGAAEKLRGSAYSLSWSTDRITSLVCRPDESDGDRKSFCELWKKTRLLSGEVTQQASSGE